MFPSSHRGDPQPPPQCPPPPQNVAPQQNDSDAPVLDMEMKTLRQVIYSIIEEPEIQQPPLEVVSGPGHSEHVARENRMRTSGETSTFPGGSRGSGSCSYNQRERDYYQKGLESSRNNNAVSGQFLGQDRHVVPSLPSPSIDYSQYQQESPQQVYLSRQGHVPGQGSTLRQESVLQQADMPQVAYGPHQNLMPYRASVTPPSFVPQLHVALVPYQVYIPQYFIISNQPYMAQSVAAPRLDVCQRLPQPALQPSAQTPDELLPRWLPSPPNP